MDELDPHECDPKGPSVKELVARIQQQHQNSSHHDGAQSESSDDEDGPLRMPSRKGPMGDGNLVPVSNILMQKTNKCENLGLFLLNAQY